MLSLERFLVAIWHVIKVKNTSFSTSLRELQTFLLSAIIIKGYWNEMKESVSQNYI